MVPTIDGKVKFDLPAGTQPGTVMSLKGKGVQYLNSHGRGDQYIRIIVEVPKDLTAPQREALENFKNTMGYSDVTPDEKRGFFGKKKKKQEGLEQATDDMSDAEVAAEGATEAGEEETEPVADGDVHNLLQNLFGEEGTSAEDFLQQEETVGEQVTEAAGKKEKKERLE